MRPNKLTSGANVFWNSSRMMIPQHKAASLLHDKQSMKNTKPELTDEERQVMFSRLRAARTNTVEVTITVFGEFENRIITGIVTGLDPRLHLIKIEEAKYDWQLIDFSDVIRVDLGEYHPF